MDDLVVDDLSYELWYQSLIQAMLTAADASFLLLRPHLPIK